MAPVGRKTILVLIFSVLIGFSFILYICGCSVKKGSNYWSRFGGLKDDSKLSKFVSNIRPAPGNPDSHYLLGCYFQEKGHHQEAIKEFQKVIAIDPEYLKAYNGMGVSHDMLGDFSLAIEYYKMGVKLNPNLDYLQNNLGYSYLLRGNFDEAVAAFEKAIALNSQDSRFHNNLGLAYGEKGEYVLAMVQFKLAGDEAKAHFNMAQLYFRKGLYKEAKDHYGKALNLDPSSTMARTGIETTSALASILQGDAGKARTEDLVVAEGPLAPEKTRKEDPETQVGPEPTPLGQEKMESHTPPAFPQAGIGSKETGETLKPKKFPKATGIEISNGNGVNRMARRVGNYLQEKGLKVVRLTNADKFTYPDTKIFYKQGYQEAANQLAEKLPTVQSIEEGRKLARGNIQIKILIGKDLAPHDKLFKDRRRS